ncbi:transposase [Methyloversatilis discipulorum]|uniref:transposase n=1 Tax=Methyloversatilis discipulorum TaxID=1119528 RepID=UPI003F2AE888
METKKSQQRFTEEFKVEAVTENGFAGTEVAVRLGFSAHSLYSWIKRHSVPAPVRAQRDSQGVMRTQAGVLRRVAASET